MVSQASDKPGNIYHLPVATEHGTTYIEFEYAPQEKGFLLPAPIPGSLHTPSRSLLENLVRHPGELHLDPKGDAIASGKEES